MEVTITAEKLTKSYGSLKALDQFDLTVCRGEIFGLLGANGAGKSTAMECILGTRKPDYGTVEILGMNPFTNRKKLYERVGVQFQETSYQDKIRVWELCQVTASLYKTPRDPKLLLHQFGLSDKLKVMVNDLSGGQKQRLFIALALIADPEVIFLDELTTGLDVRARRDVWNSILKLKEDGLTVLLTSHFMDEVETLCDKIMILKNGRTVFEGTVNEAIQNSPYDQLEDAYFYFTEEERKNESI
ncbi:ABC-2 type transport system ATP-binding protein [Lacrimispora xylanisolvens]|uniref:ABC-2 type transport system ATP-binding protein n=1 Tax=Lacrimispora xylanisolvens TaxID=384636 RepID=A0A2S6HS32_9FIRM|nr:ABC transporter ATP-binding protein [Hungatella xylanolytica]PPK80337.1 ABC-2 type transport system ATP-binding protein [Hungatella xylanolytica]